MSLAGPDAGYRPPTAAEIASAQNADANLKLLLAQRRLYSVAKIWSGVRGVGVGAIAIAAPVLTAIWPAAAVPVASVAAVWYVLSHLLFQFLEQRGATRAAFVQEQFDTAIFGMPTVAARGDRVSPEDVAQLTGSRFGRSNAFAIEELADWYPIQTNVSGAVAIAIAQRGNVAYSRRLLDRHAALWVVLLVLWCVGAVAISLANNFSLATFLLVVAIPVLPPLVDAWEEFRRVRAAGRERRALADEIQDAVIAARSHPLRPEQLIAWQSQVFALRRNTPLVPDWLYKLLRSRNEMEMSEAAAMLAEQATREESN